MPATARHGAAQATHTTSRTTANVSYHLWQHCCWQDTTAGALSSAWLLNIFSRGLPQHWFLSFVACSNGAAVDDEFRAYCTSLLIRVSFQLWWVVASPLPPQPPQASAARVATRYPAPSFPSLPPALGAPPARGGTERRTTRAHV